MTAGLRALAAGFFLGSAPAYAQSQAERAQVSLDELNRLKSNLSEKERSRFRFDGQTQEIRSAYNFKAEAQAGRDPRDVAVDFIQENRKLFFNPPEEARGYAPAAFGPAADNYIQQRLALELDRDHPSAGERNILFRERYDGIPVEFSRVSAHLTPDNRVFAAFSSLDSGVAGVNPKPKISEAEALAVVIREWAKGFPIDAKGQLVYLPKRFEEAGHPTKKGKTRLAWKFRFRFVKPTRDPRKNHGLWSVYVDAHTGELVGDINELKSFPARLRHFQRDPNEGATGILSTVRGLEVVQGDNTGNLTLIPTNAFGRYDYAGSGYLAASTLFAVLRTTYAAVIDEKGTNPIYAEGGAAWSFVNVSSASASPYPVSSRLLQQYICPDRTVFSNVRFSAFDVGFQPTEDSGGQEDLDFVEVLQSTGHRRLAVYTGQNKGSFTTFSTTGTQLDLRLVSNATDGSGNEGGYQVNRINCLVQNANVNLAALPDLRFFDSDGVLISSNIATPATAAHNEDEAYAVAIDHLGRIVVAGASDNDTSNDLIVMRFYADGTLDTSFSNGDADGVNGVFVFNGSGNGADEARGMAIDSSGRILVAGFLTAANQDAAVWRLSADGILDTTFSNGDADGVDGVYIYNGAGNGTDQANAITIDSSGRILVAGFLQSATNRDMAVWRLSSNGLLDTAFATAGEDGVFSYNGAGDDSDEGNAIVVLSSGPIIVAGYTERLSATNEDMAVWRLNSSGILDTSFSNGDADGINGVFAYDAGPDDERGQGVVVDSLGRIIVAGYSERLTDGNEDIAVWRLSASGLIDTSFGSSGLFAVDGGQDDDRGHAVTLDSSGRILVAGFADRASVSNEDLVVLRILDTGSIDTSFGSSGLFGYEGGIGQDRGQSLVMDPFGRPLVAGFSEAGVIGNNDLTLIRLDANGALNVVTSNALKHIEEMHGYFTAGSERYNAVLSTRPAVIHVNFGDELVNAFFDPETDILAFGEGGDLNFNRNIALATDVIYHEYTHLVVDHIYNIANFGQDGAISEAYSDFFALDAFNVNYPALGKTTFGDFAFPDRAELELFLVRELNQSSKKKYPNDWVGEIHDDSLILSGALWDLRTALGPSLTKNLVRDAMFYFPDSFQSFYEALITTSAGRFDSTITSIFNNHGIGSWAISGADTFEPNDGFQTATALASGVNKKATIFPAGDLDYYRLVAGAGPVTITLKRPLDPQSFLYFAYGFFVYDINRLTVGQAMPEAVFELPASGGKFNSAVGEQNASVTLNLAAPQLLYVAVSAPILENSNDTTNSSSLQYELFPSFNAPVGSISGNQVSASMADQRNIRYTALGLTGYEVEQATEAVVDHVDILDHNMTKLSEASASFLTVTTTTVLPGRLEGVVTLPANFFDRYPSVGTIHMEMFVRNALGRVYSVGVSNPIKVFSDTAKLTAYNNIFNPVRGQRATLKYSSTGSGRYRLAIYTINGDLVRMLVDREEEAGLSSVDWDGRNGAGEMVASGIYFVHLEGPSIKQTQKIVVVK
ncbi:MAG: hypothetical protein HYT79_11020 [Elusimicrobia bacterium]|nr:hypothetical protein [Elusimicrobiota bacterium]